MDLGAIPQHAHPRTAPSLRAQRLRAHGCEGEGMVVVQGAKDNGASGEATAWG